MPHEVATAEHTHMLTKMVTMLVETRTTPGYKVNTLELEWSTRNGDGRGRGASEVRPLEK